MACPHQRRRDCYRFTLAPFYVGDCTFGNKYSPMVISSVVANPGNVLLVVRSCNVDRYEAVCVTRTALIRGFDSLIIRIAKGGGIAKFCRLPEKMKVSVIIPCYNEKNTIERIVQLQNLFLFRLTDTMRWAMGRKTSHTLKMTTTAIKWVRHLILERAGRRQPMLDFGSGVDSFFQAAQKRGSRSELRKPDPYLSDCLVRNGFSKFGDFNGVPDNSLEFDFRVKCIRAHCTRWRSFTAARSETKGSGPILGLCSSLAGGGVRSMALIRE